MAPLFQYGYFDTNTGLLLALCIGIAFGVVLERAGFGDAVKLASQFYGKDGSVFKVMFTAIITAMLGVFWLGWFGILDLERIYVLPTYVAPQTIGGLVFGAGFVMGGYCPGTCCVAAVTGNIDGWMHFAGMILGILSFGWMFPWVEQFYNSTAMGQVTIDRLFNVSYGIVVCCIVVLALLGFYATGKIEEAANSGKHR